MEKMLKQEVEVPVSPVLSAVAARPEEESAILLTGRECLASLTNLLVPLAVRAFCLQPLIFVVSGGGHRW